MVATSVLPLFTFLLKITTWVGFIPFRWEAKIQRLAPSKTLLSWLHFCFWVSVIYGYELFLLGQSYRLSSLTGVPAYVKVKVYYHLVAFVLYNVNQYPILLRPHMLTALLGNVVKLAKDFQSTCPRKEVNIRKTRVLMICYVFTACFMIFTMVLGVWRFPGAPVFLSSIFGKKPPLEVVIPACVLHFGAHACLVLAFAFNVLIVGLYVHVLINFLTHSRFQDRASFPRGQLSNEDFIRFYQRFSILQNHFNATFGRWVLGVEVMLLWVVIINLFIAVVFGTVRGIVNAAMMSILFLQLYKMLGQVYELSTASVKSWQRGKSVQESIWMQKTLRSFRPISMSVGSFYFADKSLSLTILSIILSNSANLILTFRYD